MLNKVRIHWGHVEPSPAVEEAVHRHFAKLIEVNARITSCRVAIELPNHHGRKGNLFHVGIDIHVPQHEVAVSRDHADNHGHEDVYVALRDAFDIAKRRLRELAKRQHDRDRARRLH